MKRAEALAKLAAAKPELERLGIRSLAIFGSVARDESGPQSDIDLLVEFVETPSLFEFVRIKQWLEQLLGCGVDLATVAALHRRMRDAILKEAIRAA